jgi:hypothetical protein
MPSVDGTIQTVTGNVSLSVTEAQIAQFTAATPFVGPGRTTPWGLVEVNLPNVTGVAAGASVTLNIRLGTTSSGTLIGSAVATNSGAGVAAVGGFGARALIPAGSEGALYIGAVTSSSTATAVATATAPIVVVVWNLD